MKALVTGIAGFAGNYLSKLLLDRGLEVYGISQEQEFRPFLALDRAAIKYTALDIQDCPRITDILSGFRPDLIFHLAAKSSPAESIECPRETFEVNFGGTLSILEAIRFSGIRCRFLFVSSSHVYGHPDASLVSEDAPLRPETPYAASKAAAELLAYQYYKSYGIEAVNVRAFNHTGPGQGQGFVCPDLARKIVEIERGLGPPKLLVASLARQIDFSDVRDIVRGYHSALTDGTPGKTYNLCAGKGIAIQTVVENLAAHSRKAIEIGPSNPECGPEGGLENSAERNRALLGDNTLAFRDLGWKPMISFPDTLREVFEYCRQSYSIPHTAVGHSSLPRTGHGCS
ncbi:MAG: GDP-mannose 4,6-dehydratase [Terriglobia bacterium]